MNVPPELLKVGSWEVVFSVPWIIGRKWRPLQGVVAPGWTGGKDSPDMIQTLQRRHKPLQQAWDGNTDKNTNTPGQVGFLPQQKCGDRAEATVFFSHKIPQREIDRDVTQEVFFFSFSWKFESAALSPVVRYFRERKQWSPRGKNDPWLAGLAPGFGRPASTSKTAFFLGLKQALA